MRALVLLALPLALAGCGSAEEASAPGGVTAGEASALNDAAEMLDINSVSAEAADAQENAQ